MARIALPSSVYVFLLLVLNSVFAKPDLLQLTAVVSDEAQRASFECWQFDDAPFSRYPTVGKSMHLADVSNVTYVVLPTKSNEGLHKPPHPMLFVLISGKAIVTLPYFSDQLWISKDAGSVIIAADTEGIGHYTQYTMETVALQIPFKHGKVPKHTVLGRGACSGQSSTTQGKSIENGQDFVVQTVS